MEVWFGACVVVQKKTVTLLQGNNINHKHTFSFPTVILYNMLNIYFQDLKISKLGPCLFESPIAARLSDRSDFVKEEMLVRAKLFEAPDQLLENENGCLLSKGKRKKK